MFQKKKKDDRAFLMNLGSGLRFRDFVLAREIQSRTDQILICRDSLTGALSYKAYPESDATHNDEPIHSLPLPDVVKAGNKTKIKNSSLKEKHFKTGRIEGKHLHQRTPHVSLSFRGFCKEESQFVSCSPSRNNFPTAESPLRKAWPFLFLTLLFLLLVPAKHASLEER